MLRHLKNQKITSENTLMRRENNSYTSEGGIVKKSKEKDSECL
jgi:hypothetical protein